METYTSQYGALTEIIDSTTSYSMKDSSGTEFTFEVLPLNMTKSNIDDMTSLLPSSKVWFIAYTTTIVQPNNNEIEKALRDGLIITLSIKCTLFDNYGFPHFINFNKDKSRYEIEINKNIRNILNDPTRKPLCDSLIKFIKNNKDFIQISTNLVVPFNRIIFTALFSEIDKLNNIIEKQEERLKILEQK